DGPEDREGAVDPIPADRAVPPPAPLDGQPSLGGRTSPPDHARQATGPPHPPVAGAGGHSLPLAAAGAVRTLSIGPPSPMPRSAMAATRGELFAGVTVALVTPFKGGDVDWDELGR